jgi:hypothetical protein
MRRVLGTTVVIATTIGFLASGSAALAKVGDISKPGACSGSSLWKFNPSQDNGAILAEFQVD